MERANVERRDRRERAVRGGQGGELGWGEVSAGELAGAAKRVSEVLLVRMGE